MSDGYKIHLAEVVEKLKDLGMPDKAAEVQNILSSIVYLETRNNSWTIDKNHLDTVKKSIDRAKGIIGNLVESNL